MTVLLVGVVASVLAGILGAGLGWLLHNQVSGAQLEMELTTSQNRKSKDKQSRQDADRDRSAELMARLAELTTSVASEVGKHTGNIEAINVELAAVKEGDAGAVVAAVQKILSANEKMQQELAVAEKRLQEQQQELNAQTEAARTDQLTKLANRRGLDEELKKCVLEFQRAAVPFSVMVLDVDHFKRFNDAHGHLAGDEVLRFVAQHLKAQTRESEFLARFGGEEFVVIFRGESVAACRERADLLRASIKEPAVPYEGKELRVAASAGVAEIGIGEDERVLIRRADEALFASKKAGRDCAHWNHGWKNIPITPALLVPRNAEEGSSQPIRSAIDPARLHKSELDNVDFSDASFSPNLGRRVAEWKRTGHVFSLAVCALDGLEEMRTAHGEELLQRIITATASVVSSCLRDMDQMAAFGEGGFAISLPTVQIQDAALVADRVRKAVERLYVPTGALPQFTVSVGVAQIIEGNDSSRLFYRAQLALEAAQENGGNSSFIHDGLHTVPAASARQAVLV